MQTLFSYDGTDHTLDGVGLPAVAEVRFRVLLDRDQLALFAADGLHYSAQNRCLEDPQPEADPAAYRGRRRPRDRAHRAHAAKCVDRRLEYQ